MSRMKPSRKNGKIRLLLKVQSHQILVHKIRPVLTKGPLLKLFILWFVRYLNISFLNASVQMLPNSTDFAKIRFIIYLTAY
jgi:hypothetical protein